MTRKPWIVLLAFASVALGACEKAAEEPEAGGQRVENAAVGLAIGSLPADVEVAVNEGSALELAVAEGGRISFLTGGVESSINLVQAAQDHEAAITARPEGVLKQRMEMAGEWGTTYFSRGRYVGDDGAAEEETVLLLIHPWGDRPLTVRYVYPVGEGDEEEVKQRVKQRIDDHLFGVFNELEDLPPPSAAAGD